MLYAADGYASLSGDEGEGSGLVILADASKVAPCPEIIDKRMTFSDSAPVLVATAKKMVGGSGSVALAGAEADDSDLFGARGGYFHPYLTIGTGYTDNLFNTDEDKVSSWEARVAPGIWFSLPRSKQVPITIEPHNTSPGGLQSQVDDVLGTGRYQAYALAGLNYRAYSEDSELDDTDGRLEGLFRYNFRGGLSLQALDSFTNGRDAFGVGSAGQDNLRRYNTNVFMATADYNITEKVRTKIDYSNFLLDYDDEQNEWLNRSDNTIDLYGYYQYSPKTSLYLHYRYIDVAYDTAELKDNSQHYGYAGITWDSTDKLSLDFKGGYQKREYEAGDELAEIDADYDGSEYDWDGFTFDLRTTYRFSPKTSFTLDGYRRSEESDSRTAADTVTFGAVFGYRQKFTEKLGASFDLLYENSDYSQVVEIDRDDDRIYLKPALQYLLREWLMFELAYTYDKRDSTDDLFDYTSNSVILNANLAL